MSQEAEQEPAFTGEDVKFKGVNDYSPFIADVNISSLAEPFPIASPDMRSDAEIAKIQAVLKPLVCGENKKFDEPMPLADFCLVARERWNGDGDEAGQDAVPAFCLLV